MYIVYCSWKIIIIVDCYDHAKGIAHGYNHQFCKPNKPDEYFVKLLN